MSRVTCAGPGCNASATSELEARVCNWQRHPETGALLCSHKCLRLVRGNIEGHAVDGGTPAGLALLERANAGARPGGLAATGPDIVIKCAGSPACQSQQVFPAGTTAQAIDRALVACGWTVGTKADIQDHPFEGARQAFIGSRVCYMRQVPAPRHCGSTCAHDNPVRAEPSRAPELSADDQEIAALKAARIGSPRPMNERGRAQWDVHQRILRACGARREPLAAYEARIGRRALLAELRGEAADAAEEAETTATAIAPIVGRDSRGDAIPQRPAPASVAVDSLGRARPFTPR